MQQSQSLIRQVSGSNGFTPDIIEITMSQSLIRQVSGSNPTPWERIKRPPVSIPYSSGLRFEHENAHHHHHQLGLNPLFVRSQVRTPKPTCSPSRSGLNPLFVRSQVRTNKELVFFAAMVSQSLIRQVSGSNHLTAIVEAAIKVSIPYSSGLRFEPPEMGEGWIYVTSQSLIRQVSGSNQAACARLGYELRLNPLFVRSQVRT